MLPGSMSSKTTILTWPRCVKKRTNLVSTSSSCQHNEDDRQHFDPHFSPAKRTAAQKHIMKDEGRAVPKEDFSTMGSFQCELYSVPRP